MLENCDVLSNIVLPDSVLKHLNKTNIQAFHGLRNVAEQEDRRFYYFYNENFIETAIKDEKRVFAGLGLDAKLSRKVLQVFNWYQQHLAPVTSMNKVYLLTTDAAAKATYKKLLKG
jgi:hypothetical protein